MVYPGQSKSVLCDGVLPDGRARAAVELSVQDYLVLLQLHDDLIDAADHSAHSLRQTLTRLRFLHGFLLTRLGQLLLYLLQVLKEQKVFITISFIVRVVCLQ